jgi:phage/plasmid-associated DNA primase
MSVNIRNDWNGNSYDTITIAEFVSRIEKKIHTYEVISDTIRYNFDVDAYCLKEEYDSETAIWLETKCIEYITDALTKQTNKKPNIVVATSHTNNYDETRAKYSLRFYVTNMRDNRESMKSFVVDLNKAINKMTVDKVSDVIEIENLFDESIYSQLKKIRCINTSKPNQDRPLILKNGTIEDTIITKTDGCIDVNYFVTQVPTSKQASISLTDTPQNKITELLDMIEINRYDRQTWLRVCACIKYNNLTDTEWKQFCYNNNLNMDDEKENLFYNLKNPHPIEIHYLQSLAKKSNPNKYKQWLQKWNIYGITFNEVNDPYSCALKIKNTLNTTLKLCKEKWFMLTDNQLWKKQNEPTFYIVKEIHKYLDHEKDSLNRKSSQAEGEEKKTLITQLENWLKLYSVITKSGYLSVLTKTLRPLLADDEFESKLDNNKGKLAFKNGIMDLQTKQFREGIMWDDFITDTIPYNYNPSSTDFIKSVLLKILNNNKEHLDYYLSLIGYSFIGDANLEKSIYFMIDKTEDCKGDNGKTFFFDILNDLFPNYVYKSKSTFILKKNPKAHKQLAEMKSKRLVWLEELPKDETNSELIKEIADGKTTENEVMFGTSEKINIMFKMFVLSNNIPNIKSDDEAVYNRYKQISFNSHFDRTGTREVENANKLEFIADTTLSNMIKEFYRDEVFNLIIEYANRYYTNKIPKIPQQFANDTIETKNKNNKFFEWFADNCEKNEDGKVALDLLVSLSKCKKDDIKSFMKKCGYNYNRDLKGIGKDEKGKYYKGGYEGVRFNELDEED